MSDRSQEVYRRFEKLLTDNNITAFALAKEIGIAPRVFYEWKSGKAMPKVDKLMKVADYFGISITYFLE